MHWLTSLQVCLTWLCSKLCMAALECVYSFHTNWKHHLLFIKLYVLSFPWTFISFFPCIAVIIRIFFYWFHGTLHYISLIYLCSKVTKIALTYTCIYYIWTKPFSMSPIIDEAHWFKTPYKFFLYGVLNQCALWIKRDITLIS